MPKILITAFEPYDRWKTNASWLTLVQLTHDMPKQPVLTTRLYPVDFTAARQRLAEDLTAGYDYSIHLGQAPGSSRIQLEAIGLNIGGSSSQSPDQFRPLVENGPVAYQTDLPLGPWSIMVRRAGIPCQVSYHAGTYLCNAMMYLAHHLGHEMQLKTRSAFIHLPLDPSQTAAQAQDLASMPASMTATAVKMILDELAASPIA